MASRARSRLRYRRLLALGSATGVTLVAVLGGLGVLPEQPRAAASTGAAASLSAADAPQPVPERGIAPPAAAAAAPAQDSRFGRTDAAHRRQAAAALAVPADSGSGRRVVFDATAQRVWLVAASGAVRRTYPVSGSVTDNLAPGSYEVYSRSERAWGIDDSGTMRFMVRFARGQRAAIGFHDIPVKDGRKVQGREELGTAMSHGCIRQWRPDAKALWAFAPLGTTVVVV